MFRPFFSASWETARLQGFRGASPCVSKLSLSVRRIVLVFKGSQSVYKVRKTNPWLIFAMVFAILGHIRVFL